eukprot:jgi/Mesvir1/13872/Mv16012-RA.1
MARLKAEYEAACQRSMSHVSSMASRALLLPGTPAKHVATLEGYVTEHPGTYNGRGMLQSLHAPRGGGDAAPPGSGRGELEKRERAARKEEEERKSRAEEQLGEKGEGGSAGKERRGAVPGWKGRGSGRSFQGARAASDKDKGLPKGKGPAEPGRASDGTSHN